MADKKKIEVLYTADIVCPVCEKSFKVTKTRSKFLKLQRRDTDQCPHYEGVNPIFYTAYVCPECGYAALERHFLTVTVNGKAEVINKISPKWQRKEFLGERDIETAIAIHKMVLLNYTVMHYPYHEIAKVCIKIAWLYRYGGDSKEEDFLKHGYQMFEKSFVSEPLEEDPKNEVNILFLMGETARRLGNFKKSVEWFGMALQTEGMKGNMVLERLTRDQWAVAKSEYKKKMKEEQSKT